MRKYFLALAVILCSLSANAQVGTEDIWHGFKRTTFEFEGYKAWVVSPWVETAEGKPWTWTMQWADAFVDRTGVLDLLKEGYHHVTIEAFDGRACDEDLPKLAAFQKYLVEELGFAPKANLVGMSWGGFFSVRYATTYPQNVRRIYLDAPLLTFDGWTDYRREVIGPWCGLVPSDGKWTDDPRMPLNMAEKLAGTGIPVLLLYGGHDQTVNPDLNCRPFIKRFKDAGGIIKVHSRDLYGHHPHGEDPDKTQTITDFFKSSTTLLVGTATNQGSEGIYVLRLDPRSKTWNVESSAKTLNPTFLALSPDGKKVYAVNENYGKTAGVEAFSFEADRLCSIGKAATDGNGPCYIATDGNLLLTANYGGGNISVLPIVDGVPQKRSQLLKGSKGGPDKSRQKQPHAHCATFTPDGEYVLATDFSADRILSYHILEGRLVPAGAFKVAPDSGPRHITFHPDGNTAYVIGELSGEITIFDYKAGTLTKVGTAQADTLHARGSADIHLSADGRFLYASNRLEGDGIAIFSVDPSGKSLTFAGYQPTGRHPRNFCLSQDGKYLFCACRDDNRIEVYNIDPVTGLLSSAGFPDIPVSMPLFVTEVKKNLCNYGNN